MRNNLFSNQQNKNLINVLFSFNGRDQYASPVRLTWNEQDYFLGCVQFWYAEHHKGVLTHHYRVGDDNGEYIFELSLETENLTWNLDKVTEVASGLGLNSRLIGALS
jgi:hypothetical protein